MRVRTRQSRLFIVDAAAVNPITLQEYHQQIVNTDVPFAVYVGQAGERLGGMLRLATCDRCRFVLDPPHGNGWIDLVAWYHETVSTELGTRLLDIIAPIVEQLPYMMKRNIQQLLKTGGPWIEVQQLACDSALSVRSLSRVCSNVGLAPPHVIIAAARLLQAYRLTTTTNYSVARVSRSCGYDSLRAANRHARRVCGKSLTHLRTMHDDTLVLTRLADTLLRSSDADYLQALDGTDVFSRVMVPCPA